MRASRRDSDRSGAEPFARKLSSIVRRGSAFLHGDDVALHQWNDNQSGELALAGGKSFGLHYLRRFSRATTAAATIEESEPSLGLADLADPVRQRRRTLEGMSFQVLHTAFAPPRVIERVALGDSDLDDDGDGDDDDDDDDVGAATWGADDNQELDHCWRVGDGAADDETHGNKCLRQDTVDDADDDDECKAAADRKAAAADEGLRRLSRAPTDGLDGCDDSNEGRSTLLIGQENGQIDADGSEESVDEDLSFDGANLTASVRKLVRRIEQASTDDLLVDSVVSNQDEEVVESHEPLTRPLSTHDLEIHSSPERRKHMSLPELPAASSFIPAHDARLLDQSCYIPMDEVQDELTASMRRLVIGLKKDSEATNDDPSVLGLRPL
ncbi:hypothetical protein ATCC90586_004313 [Pythium insidiosum]|nr:hypothetical protein ATCC90586_004313 [Pythium insidiosum]